jgi:hypothetical protein
MGGVILSKSHIFLRLPWLYNTSQTRWSILIEKFFKPETEKYVQDFLEIAILNFS